MLRRVALGQGVYYVLTGVWPLLSLVVTQLEVTATYDPARVTRDEILRVLRSNPEVKLRSEPVEE